jgi:hypothetical protein
VANDKQEAKRVEVGFSGGQAITLRLTDRGFADLRKAVQGRDGWFELETADGPVALDSSQVVFVKRESGEHRIGFSGT